MSHTTTTADVKNYIVGHLESVFETMLSLKAVPAETFDVSRLKDGRVSGSVGLAGDVVTGSIYLHVTTPFARQATSAMLGLPAEELTGNSEVNDVIGEVTNMLAGGLKSWLCDAGAPCVLTTPAVIHGAAYAVTFKPDVQLVQVGFDCDTSHGLVEVHLKFN